MFLTEDGISVRLRNPHFWTSIEYNLRNVGRDSYTLYVGLFNRGPSH